MTLAAPLRPCWIALFACLLVSCSPDPVSEPPADGSEPDAGSDSPSGFGPVADDNPWVGDSGAATMHGDAVSSDTTRKPGPGGQRLRASHKGFAGACSTVLIRSDGLPMVLCTAWIGRAPVVRLVDPQSSDSLAEIALPSGSLLGGVYAYLDHQDRLVMVDGNQDLVRIAATRSNQGAGTWQLSVDQRVALSSAVTAHCGGGDCDAVVAISPDGDGSVWFATRSAVVGVYDPTNETTEYTALADAEAIHNSFSTTNDGRAAIATDHALYLLDKDEEGRPAIVWRRPYDRGSARKPGQLSYGTGATPTFFGPSDGADFVTITDNADGRLRLLVFEVGGGAGAGGGNGGQSICELELFDPEAAGTENSAIAAGRSVIVASTYGYPYPDVPEGAGPAVPESADFKGGMVRVDVRIDRAGCDLIWQNNIRSSAVPKLSIADELIYTIERDEAETYYFAVVNPHTGGHQRQLEVGRGALRNTLQMAGNVGADRVYWQGTVAGLLRVEPADGSVAGL